MGQSRPTRRCGDCPKAEFTKHRSSLFKNILNTLNHPLVTDRMWWAHMHREPHLHKALNEVLYADFKKLAAAREEMDQRLVDYVDDLSEDDADEQIDFTLLSGAKGRMSRRMICMHIFNQGLRRIEWVIFGLKTRETWGLRGDFAFYGIWNLSMTDGWHEHRNVDGGFGIHIGFLVFDQNRQCAAFLVTRKRA